MKTISETKEQLLLKMMMIQFIQTVKKVERMENPQRAKE
jgi:hypothetical protein